ncbi:hypothetical protein [Fictibacillus sp. S7]|uniref:hypothetical protein n=1 Tax=Fictibacillus sp. S7 TaxID=2212476 RepID=UPI001010BC1B|nr:hypothetical protein [Fictibacillus sp. S7]RXZ02174.1 hypothetical protein DMO16_22450 [Fictibacillus sp. S7]
MKENIVLRWTVSAIAILVLVIGGYSVYANMAEPKKNEHGHEMSNTEPKTKGTNNQKDEHAGHVGEESPSTQGEISPVVYYEDNLIHIVLKDKEGNAVKNLAVNHEKLMHLIIVNEDLKEYYHIHPEKKDDGVFTVKHKLSDGNYKAFVDIKPTGKKYMVEPILFKVGEGDGHGSHEPLKPDTNFTKTVNNYTVTMNPQTFKPNEEIILEYDLKDGKPEPYLGALGHVVILDAKGEKYVHVHPVSQNDTKFATKFDKLGVYKVWSEFKINGKVHVFPYVVNVK